MRAASGGFTGIADVMATATVRLLAGRCGKR
jgi:hypothetical protein